MTPEEEDRFVERVIAEGDEYLEGLDEHQDWLASQPEDVKEAGVEAELARASTYLGADEVQAAESMDDDEADRALADEIATMKARDPREWVRLLASLPQAERDEMRRVEKKYGV